MSTDLAIVPFADEHKRAVKGLLGEMTAEYAPLAPHIFLDHGGVEPDVDTLPEAYQRVAILDGVVVGYAYGKVQSSTGHPALRPRRFFLLNELVVTASARGAGIGATMLHDSEAWAKAQGVDQIELNVYAISPAAQRFYRRHGYEPLVLRLSKPLGD